MNAKTYKKSDKWKDEKGTIKAQTDKGAERQRRKQKAKIDTKTKTTKRTEHTKYEQQGQKQLRKRRTATGIETQRMSKVEGNSGNA
eukprot:5373591-Karenia_brevis.AAC.1